MSNRKHSVQNSGLGFTLVELLVVMTIIAILAGMALMALAGATEQARVDRTNAEVTKLDELVTERYDGYRARPLPMRPDLLAKKLGMASTPTVLAQMRYYIAMEVMRMELPERITDLQQPAVFLSRANGNGYAALQPAMWLAMRRKSAALTNGQWDDSSQANFVPNLWTTPNSNAECLYLIISCLRDEETTGLDYFTAREIGDTDGDNIPEILDAWGQPIRFLRWAPGFCATANPASNPTAIPIAAPTKRQTGDATNQHDPFDPYKLFPTNYAIYPLIYSAGQDKRVGINGGNVDYATLTSPSFPNNPYHTIQNGYSGIAIGACIKENSDPADTSSTPTYEFWHDNITNHFNVAR